MPNNPPSHAMKAADLQIEQPYKHGSFIRDQQQKPLLTRREVEGFYFEVSVGIDELFI